MLTPAWCEGRRPVMVRSSHGLWWNFTGRTDEEIHEVREDWMTGSRFGEVKGYAGDRLDAPAVPATLRRPGAGALTWAFSPPFRWREQGHRTRPLAVPDGAFQWSGRRRRGKPPAVPHDRAGGSFRGGRRCQSAAFILAAVAGGLSWTQPALLGAPSSLRRKSM